MKDEMKESEGYSGGEVVAIAVIVAITVFLATGAMCGGAIKAEKDRAIAAGVARYAVNPQTGETKFEYIQPNPAPTSK